MGQSERKLGIDDELNKLILATQSSAFMTGREDLQTLVAELEEITGRMRDKLAREVPTEPASSQAEAESDAAEWVERLFEEHGSILERDYGREDARPIPADAFKEDDIQIFGSMDNDSLQEYIQASLLPIPRLAEHTNESLQDILWKLRVGELDAEAYVKFFSSHFDVAECDERQFWMIVILGIVHMALRMRGPDIIPSFEEGTRVRAFIDALGHKKVSKVRYSLICDQMTGLHVPLTKDTLCPPLVRSMSFCLRKVLDTEWDELYTARPEIPDLWCPDAGGYGLDDWDTGALEISGVTIAGVRVGGTVRLLHSSYLIEEHVGGAAITTVFKARSGTYSTVAIRNPSVDQLTKMNLGDPSGFRDVPGFLADLHRVLEGIFPSGQIPIEYFTVEDPDRDDALRARISAGISWARFLTPGKTKMDGERMLTALWGRILGFHEKTLRMHLRRELGRIGGDPEIIPMIYEQDLARALIVEEWFPGKTLCFNADSLDYEGLTAANIQKILKNLGDVLLATDNLGLAAHDFKPDNVKTDDQFNVRVMDWNVITFKDDVSQCASSTRRAIVMFARTASWLIINAAHATPHPHLRTRLFHAARGLDALFDFDRTDGIQPIFQGESMGSIPSVAELAGYLQDVPALRAA